MKKFHGSNLHDDEDIHRAIHTNEKLNKEKQDHSRSDLVAEDSQKILVQVNPVKVVDEVDLNNLLESHFCVIEEAPENAAAVLRILERLWNADMEENSKEDIQESSNNSKNNVDDQHSQKGRLLSCCYVQIQQEKNYEVGYKSSYHRLKCWIKKIINMFNFPKREIFWFTYQ